MTEYIELEFHIEETDPNSISAKELLKIVTAWVKELGEEDNVHFNTVRSGCACAVLKIDKNVFPKVSENLSKRGVVDRLNKTLAENNRYGFIKTANDNKDFSKMELEGIKLYEKKENITIYDETQIKGKITSISGKDSTVNIKILGTSGEIYKCVVSDKEAKNMSWGEYIQADVSGEWILLENGKWDTPPRKKLTIEKYKQIKIYDNKTILEKMSNIISEETFNKIQDSIKMDMQEAE